jgi:hypothetical protein
MIGAPLLALHSLEAVALGYSVLTIAYLPRQLALYLRPIGGTTMQYMRALAGPALLSIALVIVHVSITRVVHVTAIEEMLLAFLELLVAYGAFVWIGWKRLREGLRILNGVFAGSGDKEPMSEPPRLGT